MIVWVYLYSAAATFSWTSMPQLKSLRPGNCCPDDCTHRLHLLRLICCPLFHMLRSNDANEACAVQQHQMCRLERWKLHDFRCRSVGLPLQMSWIIHTLHIFGHVAGRRCVDLLSAGPHSCLFQGVDGWRQLRDTTYSQSIMLWKEISHFLGGLKLKLSR